MVVPSDPRNPNHGAAGLDDQFEFQILRVLQPVLLCNPVTKTHNGTTEPINPGAHLVCYRVQTLPGIPTPKFRQRTVGICNQFECQDVRVLDRSNLLCVPSEKREK